MRLCCSSSILEPVLNVVHINMLSLTWAYRLPLTRLLILVMFYSQAI